MAIEKRKERRIRVRLPIKMVYQNNKVLANTENISRLGAYVELGKQILAGTDVNIVLKIPAYTQDSSLTGELKCKGDIFRSDLARESESKKYYGIGIFFTDFLTPADREKLSKYIDFLIRKEEQEIEEGVKHWREKREKPAKETDPHAETINLLKKILSRLDKISRQLQTQNKG